MTDHTVSGSLSSGPLDSGRIEYSFTRSELSQYEGERILLVGGAGFIGSHMADQLCRLGASVVVLDDLRNGSRENLSDCDVELVEASIEDCDVEQLLRSHRIERVVQLACGSLVQSLTNAPLDFQMNAVNSVKCLEAFRCYGQGKAFVYCSTGSVYGEPEGTGYTEVTPLRPSTPYGTSKACADLYAQLYASFFQMPVRIVRYNNIYGPRKMGTAVPTFILRALSGESIIIEGGEQVRTPTFVLDAVEATLLVARAPGIDGEAFNVSARQGCSIDEMVAVIWAKVNGTDVEPEIERRDYRPGEIMVLQPSVEKIKQVLGWEASFDFSQGLDLLVPFLRQTGPAR